MTATVSSPETFRWRFASAAPEPCRALLASGAWLGQAVLLKSNRRRAVFLVPGEPGVVVKHDRSPGLLDRLKARWRPAGAREFAATEAARRAGVPVPAPIGHAQRGGESLFAATEVPNCVRLRHAWAEAQGDRPGRESLLAALHRFASAFAAARVVHPDMHPGNLLVCRDGADLSCVLVDLAGARVLPPGRPADAWDTAGWLTHLAPALRPAEAAAILCQAGIAPTPDNAARLWRTLLRRNGRSAAGRWRGRRARLLAESSLCERRSDALGTWLLARPFSLDDARAAILAHRAQVARDDLIKNDTKRRLSRVRIGGMSYIVKEFRAPGRGPCRADRRSWLNHYRMMPDALPVCRCHAWLRAADGPGYLVLEDRGTQNLRDRVSALDARQRRPLLAAAMRLIAGCQGFGLQPRDLKATNVVVGDGPAGSAEVALVDCDAVHVNARIGNRQRARGLEQFLANLPASVSRRERLRAAAAYRWEAGLEREALRAILRRVPSSQ